MTGCRLTSSIPAMMRSLSSCFDVTRMWRKTGRANLEKKPSTRLSQEPCLGVMVNSKRPAGRPAPPLRRMRVYIREEGEDDIADIFAWVAKEDPITATHVVGRVLEQINRLHVDSLSEMGRLGRVAGTRELIEHPYIIVYRILSEANEIHVLAVVHGARRS
jgi:toxin ParE1/3/4